MAAREIDLDKVVDYRAEYTAVVQKYKLAGDKLTVCALSMRTGTTASRSISRPASGTASQRTGAATSCHSGQNCMA